MSVDNGYLEYVMSDVLCNVQGLHSRKMFGGVGIYKEDLMCALIEDDQLYFKVDDGNWEDYEAVGSLPFTAEMKGRTQTMSYWLVPEDVMEDHEKAETWLGKAYEAAKRAKH